MEATTEVPDAEALAELRGQLESLGRAGRIATSLHDAPRGATHLLEPGPRGSPRLKRIRFER